jgi:hypothetical protein
VIPAHTSLRSRVPAFMSPTRGISQSCEYAAHVSKNASHIATLALDVPFPENWFRFFFFSCLKDIGQDHLTRSRYERSLCVCPLRGSSPPVPGSIFYRFCRVLLRVDFRHFLTAWQLFRHLHHYQHVITIVSSSKFVGNTSWNHQNSPTHEKWSKMAVFEGLKKEAQNGCFLACFWPHRKITFFWHHHIINTSKNEALKKCLKKMSFWKKSKIF